jgi:hypothetical protein
MRVLDEAVTAALAELGDWPVYYGSAERDTPPPYFVHRSTGSGKGELGRAGMGFSQGAGVQAREYDHSVVAVSKDPDEVEAMREAVVERFQGLLLSVPGWRSQPCDWAGEVHDPGDLLPGGSIGYEAGDRWTIRIFRP